MGRTLPKVLVNTLSKVRMVLPLVKRVRRVRSPAPSWG